MQGISSSEAAALAEENAQLRRQLAERQQLAPAPDGGDAAAEATKRSRDGDELTVGPQRVLGLDGTWVEQTWVTVRCYQFGAIGCTLPVYHHPSAFAPFAAYAYAGSQPYAPNDIYSAAISISSAHVVQPRLRGQGAHLSTICCPPVSLRQKLACAQSLNAIPEGSTVWITFTNSGYMDMMLNWVRLPAQAQ